LSHCRSRAGTRRRGGRRPSRPRCRAASNDTGPPPGGHEHLARPPKALMAAALRGEPREAHPEQSSLTKAVPSSHQKPAKRAPGPPWMTIKIPHSRPREQVEQSSLSRDTTGQVPGPGGACPGGAHRLPLAKRRACGEGEPPGEYAPGLPLQRRYAAKAAADTPRSKTAGRSSFVGPRCMMSKSVLGP
jgi:hypothetical protein